MLRSTGADVHDVQRTLSKSAFKPANCLLSLTRCQVIPASVSSSISWMNARHEAMTVGREMFVNEVCIIIHQGVENIKTFSSRPRPTSRLYLQDQDQEQDFYFKTKTKTKTIFHVLEAPRDQDQGLETTSLVISVTISFIKCSAIADGPHNSLMVSEERYQFMIALNFME